MNVLKIMEIVTGMQSVRIQEVEKFVDHVLWVIMVMEI